MIITGDHVRAAAKATLQQYLPDVLTALSAQEAQTIPTPKATSWVMLEDFRQMSDQQSPSIVITCAGLPNAPLEDEDSWQPQWLVKAFVIVGGRTYEETAARVTHYCAAIRTVWGTHRSLGGLSTGGQWRGESYTELDRRRERTIAAGSVTFTFNVPVTLDLPGTEATSSLLNLLITHPALVEGPTP